VKPVRRAQLPTGKNPWQRLDSQPIYANPWLRVREDQVINAAGNPGIYGVVEFAKLTAGILPLFDNGDTMIVGQWRYPLDCYSWELPEGGGSKDEPAIESARRELSEETGLKAAHWHAFLSVHTSNSVTDEIAHCFLAWELAEFAPQPDEDEALGLVRISFCDLLHHVETGAITDALTVAMVLKARHLAREGRLPELMPSRLCKILTQ
jgi:8-oxo-dGTP pyrophosphatase MutT (NUDIX family)